MLKKTITYVNYNTNEEITEDFFFNLSKAEVMEMELSTEGGLAEQIKKVVATKNAPAIIKIFKDLILKAYGEKSSDGRRFLKEDENGHKLYKNFEQTDAYSVLFTELATDDKAAAAFVNGIVPADMAKNAALASRN